MLDAPRERVFRAWTEPAELRKWFSPEGYTTPLAEVDLRVGGRYRIGMQPPGGEDFHYVNGTYREILPPERLVFTWSWEDSAAPSETLVTVEFHDRGGSTEVVLLHERFPSEEERRKHEHGWKSCLESLAAALWAEHRSGDRARRPARHVGAARR